MSGGGSAGKTQTSSTTTDPWLSKINQLAYEQTKAGIAETGGLKTALQPNPFALPGSQETALYQRAAGIADRPLLDPLEVQGLERLRRESDPTLRLESAADIYSTHILPMLSNQAVASGMGRSGAAQEATATGFSSMILPILAEASRTAQTTGLTELGLGAQLPSREAERIDIALRGAAAPRLAESQEFMRPHNIMTSLIGGLPYGGGTITQVGQTKAFRGDTDWLMDVIMPLTLTTISSVGSAAGSAAASGCWIARALYGAGTKQEVLARYWIMTAWRSRTGRLVKALYLRYGERVSKHPRLCRLLRPLFDRAVQKAARALGVS